MSVLNFTCNNCGEHSKPNFGVATAPGEMFPPYNININGNEDLSRCIVWNDKGRVYNIRVIHNIGISYTVVVDGEGPHGDRQNLRKNEVVKGEGRCQQYAPH